jgi:hypothetical protein
MSAGSLLRLVAVLIIVSVLPVQAQQGILLREDLLKWQQVPPDQGGIVLIIDDVVSVSLSDEKRSVLDAAKWIGGLPFVRQYRVGPGTYQLRWQNLFPA